MEFTREELELIKKRIATRKMEAQCGGGGGGGGAAGGEMRKIHIIYFLSRKGRTEHPHLIKVHHLSRNGVRLRDVKRWLSGLRGKDMPESFAWSYKRRYKTGYLWQDLVDEDLITPISDNEYVLKGSEIPSFDLYLRSPSKSRASSFQEDEVQEHRKSTMEAPKNSTCEIEEESPTFGSEASTVTDDSTKLEEEKNISGENKPETPRKSDKIDNYSSFYSSLLNKNNSNKTKKNDASNPTSAPAPPPPPTPRSSQFTKSKSYSANVFRNLLSCGAVDANETAMVTINRREKNSSHIIPPKKPADVENVAGYGNAARICRGDKLGGSERVFRTSWHHEQKPHPDARKSCDGGRSSSNSTKGEFNNLKPVSAAYKPINGPNCSQCGKMFKPEKLHKHMKSCRGMKSLAKGATSSASVLETRRSSVDSACQESVSGYFLTDGSEIQ